MGNLRSYLYVIFLCLISGVLKTSSENQIVFVVDYTFNADRIIDVTCTAAREVYNMKHLDNSSVLFDTNFLLKMHGAICTTLSNDKVVTKSDINNFKSFNKTAYIINKMKIKKDFTSDDGQYQNVICKLRMLKGIKQNTPHQVTLDGEVYYEATCQTKLHVFAISKNITNVIHCHESTYLVEHLATSECRSDQPYYYFFPNQEIKIQIISAIQLQSVWCKLDDYDFNVDFVFFKINLGERYLNILKIKDIGLKSGDLTCKLYYETFKVYETRLYVWCRIQINIVNDIDETKPISNLVSTYIHAEVSADPVKPYLVKEVAFYENSTVTVNCSYGETEHARSMQIKVPDQKLMAMTLNSDTHQIGPIENLNERFDGTVISCVETEKETNLTHETALKFVYYDNFTSPSIKNTNKYVNVTNYIAFKIKSSFGDVLSTTECFNEQSTYRVPRESLVIVTVIPDIKMTAGWCKINDLKFISESFITRNRKMEGDYYLSIRIPSVGYVSGNLICEMQYEGRAIGLCRTYIDITDGKTFLNNTDIRSKSSLVQAMVSMDNSSTAAELVFQDDSSLVVDCQFGGEEYEHALIFKDSKENTTVLRKSDIPFVWGPVDMNLTYDNSQFVCVDRHKTFNVTREMALRLMSYYYSDPITRVLGRQWISIIAGTAVLVVLMITIVSVYLWRKGICSHKDVPTSTVSRPVSKASGDYEYVYDVPYELMKRRDKILEKMKKEAEGPKKPAPPPLETMPEKIQNKSPAQMRSAVLHEDSLIPLSDLHLLQIDSEGYQIPVAPRLLQ